MKTKWIAILFLPLVAAASASPALAQGKGKGNAGAKAGQSKGHGNDKAKGAVAKPAKVSTTQHGNSKQAGQMEAVSNAGGAGRSLANGKTLPASANASARASVATANRGRAVSRFARDLRVSEVRPAVRSYVVSNRPSEYLAGGAIAYALARGASDNALLVAPVSNQVFLRNRKGDVLVSLDDDRARTLGAWQVAPLNDRVNSGAPSFCRSGAGHPVWGRQWCLDKGFGLGSQQDVGWGTTRTIGDVIFGRRPTSATIPRDALLELVGPTTFDRLALHAITLGYTDPLTAVWHSEATGPEVLLVNSGRYPVAELVDTNRDQRADLMLVALRPW